MLPPRQAGRRRAQYAACIQVRYGKVDSEHEDIDAVLNMAPTDHATEIVPPAEEPEEMPLPSDANVIFLGGLFVLALLATAYVASEIVLPLVFAIILKLLLMVLAIAFGFSIVSRAMLTGAARTPLHAADTQGASWSR
jgi:hypothetical protein